MGYNSIPPRWEEYSNIGKVIPGTQIIPFKVPLRKEICANLIDKNASFTTNDLMDIGKEINLSLVIDLTMTTRFYRSDDLVEGQIEYVKFAVMGGGNMPREHEVNQFCTIISNHLRHNPIGVVGVHCTHGLNRTGYFICRYMIDCLGFPGPYSVKLFENCRGHEFDRDNYRDYLRNRMPARFRIAPPSYDDDEAELCTQKETVTKNESNNAKRRKRSRSPINNEMITEKKNSKFENVKKSNGRESLNESRQYDVEIIEDEPIINNKKKKSKKAKRHRVSDSRNVASEIQL